MTDRTTKLLLGIIALGLWAHLALPLLRPIEAVAQSNNYSASIDKTLSSIDLNIALLENGRCRNSKLC